MAVQLTVHDDVLTGDELLNWVREAAGAELGIDPSDFRAAATARTA